MSAAISGATLTPSRISLRSSGYRTYRRQWRREQRELVIPRESGVSSTLRLFGSITAVSGILDHPPQCAIAHKAGDDGWRRGDLTAL